MPRNPIANDRRELADLYREAAILPRRDAQCVFVEPDLSAVIARIKTAIEPRLCEEINLRSDLRIEEKRQTRIEEIVDRAVDQPGWRLFEMIKLQIEQTTHTCAQIVLERGYRERVVETIEQIINFKRGARCTSEGEQADYAQQFHRDATVARNRVGCRISRRYSIV